MPQTQLIRSAPNVWRWVKLPDLLPSTTSESELLRRGYQLLSPDQSRLAACAASQLGRLVRIDQQKDDQLWVHKQDHAWAEEYPVALGVLPPEGLLHLFPFGTIDLNTRRPPPGLGRLAFIAEEGHWQLIERSFSAEMEELYQHLEQKVHTFWGNSEATFDTVLLWICRAQGGYELQRHIWQEARLSHSRNTVRQRRRFFPFQKEEQEPSKELLSQLEQAQSLVESLPSISGKDWDALRSLAQQLAAAHCRAGHPKSQLISLQAVEEIKAPEQVLPARAAGAIAASTLYMPTDEVSQAVLHALRAQTPFRVHGALARARCELPEFAPERKVLLHLTLPAELQKVLGDHLLTTWLAIVSVLIQKQKLPPGELTALHPVSSKEILTHMRLARAKGSFLPDQYQRLTQEVAVLAQMHLRISWSKPLGEGQARLAYPLLGAEFAEGPHGRQEIIALGLGGWVRAVPEYMSQLCTIPIALLKLTPYAQRLGLELSLEFIQSPKGINIELETLLNRAGIIVNTHTPNETFVPVEKAFKKLAAAGIIAETPYFSKVSKEVYFSRWLGSENAVREQQTIIEGRKANWWQHYLKQRIHIEPPFPSVPASTKSIQRVSGKF